MLWVEKPMNLALPDLRIASAVSLNSWLVTMLIDSSTRALVTQAVDEEQVDVVGPQSGQPLVDHAEQSFGRARHVFGDEDDLLADLGVLIEPLLEVLFGAVQLGRVEDADAVGEGRCGGRVRRSGPLLPRASSPRRRSCPAFAWAARRVFATSSCAARPGVRLTAEAVASSAGLEKFAAIGPVRFFVGHRFRLLVRSNDCNIRPAASGRGQGLGSSSNDRSTCGDHSVHVERDSGQRCTSDECLRMYRHAPAIEWPLGLSVDFMKTRTANVGTGRGFTHLRPTGRERPASQFEPFGSCND